MKNLNKLFMFGFGDDFYINSFFEKNHLDVMHKKDFLVERAINEKKPILFFVEKHNVFIEDWVCKYLEEIENLYPFSKFILNITKPKKAAEPEVWTTQASVLKHFIKNDQSVDKFLLSRQIPEKYGISNNLNFSDFQLKNFMLFDSDSMNPELMESFISEGWPDDSLQ